MAALNQRTIRKLLSRMSFLHAQMLEVERRELPTGIHRNHIAGARNLLHYVALRRHDIRALQTELASIGLSSLGRAESHVMASFDAVLNLLKRLMGEKEHRQKANASAGGKKLEQNTEALMGTAPHDRKVRMMVTMPGEAASDYGLVRRLLANGMNCM